MGEYEAIFEIESKSDAYVIERVVNQLYDSLQEESQTVREGTTDSTQMLEQFQTIRDAVQNPQPGRFTAVYETQGERFEE